MTVSCFIHERVEMRSRNKIRNELVAIKKKLEQLQSKELELQSFVIDKQKVGKEKSDQTNDQLWTLLKYMIEENKMTRLLMEQLSKNIQDQYADADLDEQQMQGDLEQEPTTKIVPISELDAKILQYMQMQHTGMACADDIKRAMSYRGRNAASARLSKLFKQGLIERHQLGHTVYYKYNAGKTDKGILIVSPPQKS
jgi:hypothetical protein